MLMFGGGHSATMADYVARLSLSAGSDLQWAADYARTPRTDILDSDNLHASGYWTTTNLPVARHIYDMMAYSVADGRLVVPTYSSGIGDNMGYDPWPLITSPKIMNYNPATKAWTVSANETNDWDYAECCEYDPVSGLIFILDPTVARKSWTYDASTDTLSSPVNVTDFEAMSYATNMIYCPGDDKFYWFRHGSPVRVWSISLNRSTWASTITELDDMTDTPNVTNETGWAWDSVNSVFGGGVQAGHFFTFDPATHDWTDSTMSVSGTWNEGAIGTLAFHALAFDPINGVYIFITDSASGRHVGAYRYA